MDGFSEVTVSVPAEEPVLEELAADANGEYSPGEGVDGFSKVTVSVPTEESVLEELVITENGAYVPDGDADGFSKVTAAVANPLDWANTINKLLYNAQLNEQADLDLSFGGNVKSTIQTEALAYSFSRCYQIKSLKLCWGGAGGASVNMNYFAEAAYGESLLTWIDLSGVLIGLYPTNIAKAFYHRNGLKEVLGEFDLSKCTNTTNAFGGCYALETIRFKAETISVNIAFDYSNALTDESVQSIIEGLADLTGGTAKTLTLHADVGAKLTEAQKNAVSAKNWTLAY